MKLVYTIPVMFTICILLVVNTSSVESKRDHLVLAYQLTPAQEKQFVVSDSTESLFWKLWDTYPTLDCIALDPIVDNGRHAMAMSSFGFDGQDDARMTCRFAWGEKGLYLFIKVNDDQFVDIINPSNIAGNDGVEFIFDKHDPKAIYTGAYWIGSKDEMTKDYIQFQQIFGNIEPITFFNRIYWSGSGQTNTSKQWNFVEAQKKLGIEIKLITHSPTEKIQEWHLPWTEMGKGGIKKPVIGQQVGLCMFYNDLDGADQDKSDLLIWCQGTPYGLRNGNQWGTLEFGPKLNLAGKKK